MRNASAAIIPLLLAIMSLFWFIWFLGGENDSLHRINEVENLQHLQERLLLSAVKRRTELAKENVADPDAIVNDYIHEIMKSNKIDDE